MFFSFTPPTDTPNTGAVRGARRLGTHDIFLNLIQRPLSFVGKLRFVVKPTKSAKNPAKYYPSGPSESCSPLKCP